MSKKINISLSDEVYGKLEKASKKYCVPKSSFIAMAISQKVDNDEAMAMMPEVVKAMQNIQQANDQLKMEQLQLALNQTNE